MDLHQGFYWGQSDCTRVGESRSKMGTGYRPRCSHPPPTFDTPLYPFRSMPHSTPSHLLTGAGAFAVVAVTCPFPVTICSSGWLHSLEHDALQCLESAVCHPHAKRKCANWTCIMIIFFSFFQAWEALWMPPQDSPHLQDDSALIGK